MAKKKKVKIELVCVGDELLSGITLNTNAHWLAAEIAKLGAILTRIIVIGDRFAEISEVVRDSLSRKPMLLLVTGGLGATYDDVTLEGVAAAIDRKTVLNKTAVLMLKKSYASRGLNYKLTRPRLKMATIPDGSRPIQNPVGSAPAVRLRVGGTEIFCLQGVPKEMQSIFHRNVIPVIKKAVGPFAVLERNYEIEGVSEAVLSPALTRIVNAVPRDVLYLKSHPRGYIGKKPRLRIQVVCRGTNPNRVKTLLRKVSDMVLQEISILRGKVITQSSALI